MPTCLVLVDGEHYPPVVEAAVARLRERGYEPLAGLFLGGTEKVGRPLDLGVPVEAGEDNEALLGSLIETHRPEVVVDLSDEPILDYRRRMRLAAVSLARSVPYEGADFRLEPLRFPQLSKLPTVTIIGTGKRTGKTALSIELARHWRSAGRQVAIVTMGRGGPPDPVVLTAAEFDRSPEGLRLLAERGLHAASDYAEDAVLAGVDTVGTRRCGGGLAGAAIDDTFHLGVSVAEGLHPELLIYEGSGTAIPPALADVTVLVASAELDPEYLRGYLGPYRLLISDALVLIGEPDPDEQLEEIVAEIRPDLPVFRADYELEPTVAVDDRKILAATTAPPVTGPTLARQLKAQGAISAAVVHSLSNREELKKDLAANEDVDLILTEIKAAAVDVVVPYADRLGVDVGFLHNSVAVTGGIGSLASLVEKAW
ncbi:MAG: 2,3-diphosphoglycerate synthetase [Acidimicrobiia bacterium]